MAGGKFAHDASTGIRTCQRSSDVYIYIWGSRIAANPVYGIFCLTPFVSVNYCARGYRNRAPGGGDTMAKKKAAKKKKK